MLLFQRLPSEDGDGERASVSTGADTKGSKRSGPRRGALEVGDLRLLEDGSERSDALVSNPVVSETASERQGGDGKSRGVNGR